MRWTSPAVAISKERVQKRLGIFLDYMWVGLGVRKHILLCAYKPS